MLNKYLKMNPIPWLTDGKNPAVTYHVKNEILKNIDSDKIFDDLLKSDLTDYFKRNFSSGILGDRNHIDLYYKGSVWFFLLAVESGYNCSLEFVSSTAEHLCHKTQLEDGGFKFDFKSSDAVGCRSGNMIYSLIKSGMSDSRTLNGIDWILKNQRKDGGWLHCPVAGFCDIMKLVFLKKSGSGLKYEMDEKTPSCPVASFTCLKALALFNSELHRESVNRGTEFFRNKRYFVKKSEKLLCGNKVNFEKIGYPLMSQYNYLSGLLLVAQTEDGNCSMNGELFNSIIKKQNSDGTWSSENRLQGMIPEKSFESRWTTLNAVRLINIIVENENQFEKA